MARYRIFQLHEGGLQAEFLALQALEESIEHLRDILSFDKHMLSRYVNNHSNDRVDDNITDNDSKDTLTSSDTIERDDVDNDDDTNNINIQENSEHDNENNNDKHIASYGQYLTSPTRSRTHVSTDVSVSRPSRVEFGMLLSNSS